MTNARTPARTTVPRIAPLLPPYTPEQDALLKKITPPAAPEVLALFQVLAVNPKLLERMPGWGGYLLGSGASLSLRDREVVINRVCARCGAEYEWGVHVTAFGKAAGFTDADNAAIADPVSGGKGLAHRDGLLLRLVDELHDSSTVSDALWEELAPLWTEPQLIELLMLAGWYHAISYVCNAARVPLERWAARWPREAEAV